jgi:hypothetical protein
MPCNPLVGVIAKGIPELVVIFIVEIAGEGFTETVKVNAAPTQLPLVEIGVIK